MYVHSYLSMCISPIYQETDSFLLLLFAFLKRESTSGRRKGRGTESERIPNSFQAQHRAQCGPPHPNTMTQRPRPEVKSRIRHPTK